MEIKQREAALALVASAEPRAEKADVGATYHWRLYYASDVPALCAALRAALKALERMEAADAGRELLLAHAEARAEAAEAKIALVCEHDSNLIDFLTGEL